LPADENISTVGDKPAGPLGNQLVERRRERSEGAEI